MVIHNSEKPLYLQIKDSLEEQIRTQVYPKGSKLPSEKELCNEFGVSRITIRQALDLLESMGLTSSVHGKGTFVKANKLDSALQKILSFSETLAVKGYHGHTEIALYEEEESSDAERLMMGFDWQRISRLHLTGYSMDEPVVVYHSLIRNPYGQKMYQAALKLEKDKTPFSTFDLYSQIGVTIGKIRQQVSAVNAPADIAQQLGLKEGDAVLVLDSVILDTDMQVIERKMGYYRTDKYSFTLDRKV